MTFIEHILMHLPLHLHVGCINTVIPLLSTCVGFFFTLQGINSHKDCNSIILLPHVEFNFG